MEITNVEQVNLDVVYQQDKAAIDVQIETAKAYPRNIKRATENAIAVVTIDIDTAKSCTYSVPRGGKAITGPSVHLAKILAQQWGNMRIESKVVSIDAKQITSEAVCFDLETNLAMKAQVKRSIVQNEYKEGKRTGNSIRMNDDMITVTGNASNSIALRNAIFSVIPKGIVDKVYNSAKAFIIGDISDETKLIKKRKQVVDNLKDTYGVTEKEIFAAVGKSAISHLMSEELLVLIGIGTAIKEGDTTVELAFKSGKKDGDTKKAELKTKVKEKEKEKTEIKPDSKENNSNLASDNKSENPTTNNNSSEDPKLDSKGNPILL